MSPEFYFITPGVTQLFCFHRFLSVAILSISLLVYPITFVSFSVSLCQVFRGLPLCLFPEVMA